MAATTPTLSFLPPSPLRGLLWSRPLPPPRSPPSGTLAVSLGRAACQYVSVCGLCVDSSRRRPAATGRDGPRSLSDGSSSRDAPSLAGWPPLVEKEEGRVTRSTFGPRSAAPSAVASLPSCFASRRSRDLPVARPPSSPHARSTNQHSALRRRVCRAVAPLLVGLRGPARRR